MPQHFHKKSAIKITPSPISPISRPSTAKILYKLAIRSFASKIARLGLLPGSGTFGTAENVGTTQHTANFVPMIRSTRFSSVQNVFTMHTCWSRQTLVLKYARLDTITIRETNNALLAIVCAIPVSMLGTVLLVR